MLVLTRKKGQTIGIGNNIQIVVTEISGGRQVKLGILAPKETKILRGELTVHKKGEEPDA
jgi:carbon storage regulator